MKTVLEGCGYSAGFDGATQQESQGNTRNTRERAFNKSLQNVYFRESVYPSFKNTDGLCSEIKAN